MATRTSPATFSQAAPRSIHARTKASILNTQHRQQVDLGDIEIVDLTGSPPSRPPRRRSDSSVTERPAKRVKGKDPEVYISLDDEDDEEQSPSPSPSTPPISPSRRKRPAESGLLSQVKCVVCLESPTDLVATPCGNLIFTFDLMQDISFATFVFEVHCIRLVDQTSECDLL
jgi:hypothetical protein